jgi:hypothetical protein
VNKTQAISGIRILSAEELAGVTDYYTRLFGVMPEHTPMLKTSSFAIGKVLVLIYSTDEIAKSQQEQLEMAIRESFQSIEKFQALRQQYPQMDAAQAMYEWQSYFVKSLHSSFQTGAPKNEGICLPRYFVKSLHSNFQTVMSRLAATNGRAVQYGVTLRTTALLDEKNSHLYDLTKTHNVLIEIPIVRPRQSTDEQDDIQ